MTSLLGRLLLTAEISRATDNYSLSCATTRRGVARHLDIEKWSHACISIKLRPQSAIGRIEDVLVASLSQYHD